MKKIFALNTNIMHTLYWNINYCSLDCYKEAGLIVCKIFSIEFPFYQFVMISTYTKKVISQLAF
jgi:hypothetical protein